MVTTGTDTSPRTMTGDTSEPQPAFVGVRGEGVHTPRMVHWTLEATVFLDPGAAGVIAAVIESTGLGCIRALVIRRGHLGLLGWSWRGGQALWSTTTWTPRAGAWTHLAASSDANDLQLYADGRIVRAFHGAGELYRGRRPQQRLEVGIPVRFGYEEIPGWSSDVRDVTLHDGALTPEELERRAHAALGIPEPPAPTPAPPQPPEPVGCQTPAHLPAWRPDGKGGLRCLQCTPPRGCDHDDHEPYWRPAGHDMRITADWWKLTCSLCETAARDAH